MWEINSLSQIESCFFAILLGFILCEIYNFIKAIRKLGYNSSMAVFIGDIIFSVFSAFLTFLFLLIFTNGGIRGYILFFTAAGFILSRYIFSNITLNIYLKFLKLLRSFFLFVSKALFNFSLKIEALLMKTRLFIKKTLKISKKLLKIRGKVLYTEKDNSAT